MAMEMLEQEVEVEDLNKADNQDQGGSGKRHIGEEGQMGRPDAQKNDNRYAIKGPADNPDPHMARERAKEYAATSGILAALQSNAPTSPFGQDTALGVDPENALGLLMGNQIGDSFGYGGLGLRGTGRGGGGNGLGTIGLGNLGTIGHGGGGGSGSGYGRGAGGLRGHRASAPSIRTGTAEVRGSLSKEVIRRYIRRSINQIRFCYEQQLARRPDLAGRVQIRFVISPSGAVTSSQAAGSTLGEPAVETCVARAVQRIAFPQPEGGGVVIVTYPFMFQSAEGGEGGE
jgi:TonB family protein